MSSSTCSNAGDVTRSGFKETASNCQILYIFQRQFTVGTLGTVVPLDILMKIDYLRAVIQFHDNHKISC
jgi:hypothetical protein